jgi:hypothetical protein
MNKFSEYINNQGILEQKTRWDLESIKDVLKIIDIFEKNEDSDLFKFTKLLINDLSFNLSYITNMIEIIYNHKNHISEENQKKNDNIFQLNKEKILQKITVYLNNLIIDNKNSDENNSKVFFCNPFVFKIFKTIEKINPFNGILILNIVGSENFILNSHKSRYLKQRFFQQYISGNFNDIILLTGMKGRQSKKPIELCLKFFPTLTHLENEGFNTHQLENQSLNLNKKLDLYTNGLFKIRYIENLNNVDKDKKKKIFAYQEEIHGEKNIKDIKEAYKKYNNISLNRETFTWRFK